MVDITIIGGGIVGLATGHALLNQNPALKIVLLEKESKVGQHQTGPNAVLAWAREGYKKTDIDLKEMWDYLSYGGFWRMAEYYRL